jgi:hypothetical protein
MRSPALALAVATLALPLLAADACAQGPGAPGGRERGASSPFGGLQREAPRGPAGSGSPMIQVQLDQFEDELRPTKEQQPAWNRYAERVASLMEELRRAREPAAATGGAAPAQMDGLVATARARVAAIEGIAEAGRALYPLLTPEQKAVADRRLARIVGPALGLPGTPVIAPTLAPAQR